MDVVYPLGAAVDVHKRTAVVSVGVINAPGQPRTQTRTFATLLADLERLAGWLAEHQVTHVAIESTGIYWKPVFNVLAARGFTVVLTNAAHVQAGLWLTFGDSDRAFMGSAKRQTRRKAFIGVGPPEFPAASARRASITAIAGTQATNAITKCEPEPMHDA